ncbi:MAG TPA: hypothetical protein VJ438_05285 [Candidatus Nanoarchaeia archaeon]|nr:hypothetical protein [Candidatus Nanoarchaeia archaeon]
MPTWCDNDLTIYGDPNEIKKFKKLVKDGDDSFSRVVVPPLEELLCNEDSVKEQKRSLIEDFDADNGYDWLVANWDHYNEIRYSELKTDEERNLEYLFRTPWHPPYQWLLILSKVFLSLTFEDHYMNIVWGSIGYYHVRKGKVLMYFEREFDLEMDAFTIN